MDPSILPPSLKAMLDTLSSQRNAALDAMAMANGQIAELQSRIEALEATLKAKAEQPAADSKTGAGNA